MQGDGKKARALCSTGTDAHGEIVLSLFAGTCLAIVVREHFLNAQRRAKEKPAGQMMVQDLIKLPNKQRVLPLPRTERSEAFAETGPNPVQMLNPP